MAIEPPVIAPPFDAQLAAHLRAGWQIVSDGPSGVQLQGPKKMAGLDQAALVLGVLTFWIYGIGFIFIAIALIDYLVFTKRPLVFLPRS